MNLTPRPTAACLLLVVAVLAAYHNSFTGTFALDDFLSVSENESLRHFSTAFSPPPASGLGGRPLANFTMALNYAIGGTATWPYHVTNVALHLGCALLLFGLVRRIWPHVAPSRGDAEAAPVAFACALLWAVHPLATGAVDYISQRTELLMAICYLLTLYALARQAEANTTRWTAVAVVACACGMACKEVMVTAPVLAFLFDRTFFAGSFAAAWRARRSLWLGLAATWLVLAAVMLASPTSQRGVGFGLGVASLDYAVVETHALVRYLQLALWPSPLIFDYGWEFARHAPSALPHLAAVTALGVATLYALWRHPLLGFAGAWFFILLAPTSSFIPIIQQPLAESRMYLPLAGLVVTFVALLQLTLGPRARVACHALAFACLLATVARNFDYADEISLWTDTTVKQPASARAHNNLASSLARAGDLTGAVLQARVAAKLEPGFAGAHTNIGVALLQAGRPAEAVPSFEEALSILPNFPASHCNLANALVRCDRLDEAIFHYESALRLDPRHTLAHNELSAALLARGSVQQAVEHGAEAVRLDPGFAKARYNLGHALQRAGRLPEAVAEFEAALRLEPDFARAREALAATQRALERH